MTANIIAAMPRILSPFIVSFPACGGKIVPAGHTRREALFSFQCETLFGAVTTRPKAASGTTRPTDTFALTSAFKVNSGRDIGPLIRLPRGARALARQGLAISITALSVLGMAIAAVAAPYTPRSGQCYSACEAKCAARHSCERSNASQDCFTHYNECKAACRRSCSK